MSTKRELHQSDLMLMLLCGEAFRRRVLNQERHPSSYLALRGKAVHKGREINLREKMEKGGALPETAVTDAARDVIVHNFQEDDIDMREFPGIPKTAIRDQAIDETVRFVSADYLEYQRMIQPTAVELLVSVELDGYDFNLGGKIDVVDRGVIVRDLKTKKRSPGATDADQSDQLSLYALLYQSWSGQRAEKMTLDCLVMLKGGIKSVCLETTRTTEDLEATLRKFAMANRAIERGVFLPAPYGSWKCSEKYCEFYYDCPYMLGKNRCAG